MAAGFAPRWCNPFALDLNACQQRSVKLCKLEWIIHTCWCRCRAMAAVMQVKMRRKQTLKRKKKKKKRFFEELETLSPLGWECAEWKVFSGRVCSEAEGSSRFKECGSYGPWICRICRGRRSRPVDPGLTLFHRWSWLRQTWSSSEESLRGRLLQLGHRVTQRSFNTFTRSSDLQHWTVDLLELEVAAEVEKLPVGVGETVVTVVLSRIASQREKNLLLLKMYFIWCF